MGDRDEDLVLQSAAESREGEPEHAIEVLTNFLRIRPSATRAKLLLASIFADEYGEDVPGAERLYREVLANSPENVPALCGLAMLHNRAGSKVSEEESIRLFTKAVDVSGDTSILSNLAYKLWDVGRLDEAQGAFERMLAAGRAIGKNHIARSAKEAIKDIKQGNRPAFVHYWCPEVEYVGSDK